MTHQHFVYPPTNHRTQGQKRFLVPLSLFPGTKKVSLSRCPFVPGQEQQQKSRDKILCPGTSRGTKWLYFAKKGKKKKIQIFFYFFSKNGDIFVPRDVPGQRSLSRDFCCCSCPGTKGQRDKETFLSRDKGTTGRTVTDCPGTSRPLETL